jgi:hypothetical protein
MRDDLLKEQLMSYARTAADEAVQPDAAAIHRRARRRYRRLAALTVTAVLLVVGDGLGLRLGNGTPTVGQPPPVPTLTRPAPVPSTATTRPPATGTTAPTGTTRAAAVTGRLPATFVGDLGGRVAVVSTSTGKVVRALTGSQPSGPAGYAVGITPDRSTVYFSLSGPEGCRQRGIWRVPSAGGQPVRVVADDNAGGQIRFSADGSRFAHASVPCPDGGEGGDVVVREADGTLVRRFRAPAAGSDLTIGQVSLGPDGRSVAVPVRLVLDAVGVRVLDVARTDAFDKGRLVKSPDPGCTPVAADFHPRPAAWRRSRGAGPTASWSAARPVTGWCTWTWRAATCAPARSPSTAPAATCTSRPWTSTRAAAPSSTRSPAATRGRAPAPGAPAAAPARSGSTTTTRPPPANTSPP